MGEPVKKEVTEPTPLPTPYDAVVLALTDLQSVPPQDRPYMRYFLTYDRSKEFYGAFSYVINSVLSHSTTIYRPQIRDKGFIIRIDLRRLWPEKEVFDKLFEEYEKLAQIDPYFHVQGEAEIEVEEETSEAEEGTVELPEDAEQIESLEDDPEGSRRFRVGREVWFVDADGEVSVLQRNGRWRSIGFLKRRVKRVRKKVVGTQFALHLLGEQGDAAPIQQLSAQTGSGVPILRADWFIVIATSAAEAENGRYYQFRLIEDSDENKSALQKWLESLGVDYDTVQNLRSDQRIARARSNITGDPRAIEYFFTSSTRASVGPSGVAITRDWFDGKIDPKRHPLKNLLTYKEDGGEAMGFLPNGMMTFILFNGKGDLIREAPPNLASDRTIPPPHQTRLQPMISCVRCHGPQEMWIEAPNDVLRYVKRGKADVFDDLGFGEDDQESLDRLAGLYSGEMDEFIRIVRNTHAKATFLATGGMEMPDVAEKLTQIYNDYLFDPVTPQAACRDLGWEVPSKDAVAFFNALVPLLPARPDGRRPEAWAVLHLRSWNAKVSPLTRRDWELEYADVMLRVMTANVLGRKLPGVKEELQPKPIPGYSKKEPEPQSEKQTRKESGSKNAPG